MSRTNDAIVVSIDRTTDCVPFAPTRIRELVRLVCRRFRIRRASVDLAITDNPGIRRATRENRRSQTGDRDSLHYCAESHTRLLS